MIQRSIVGSIAPRVWASSMCFRTISLRSSRYFSSHSTSINASSAWLSDEKQSSQKITLEPREQSQTGIKDETECFASSAKTIHISSQQRTIPTASPADSSRTTHRSTKFITFLNMKNDESNKLEQKEKKTKQTSQLRTIQNTIRPAQSPLKRRWQTSQIRHGCNDRIRMLCFKDSNEGFTLSSSYCQVAGDSNLGAP